MLWQGWETHLNGNPPKNNLIYKWEMVRTDVRWALHFTRELPFLKVIETHETTQTKGNLICMHHTRSECPRSPGTPLFGHVKFGFISWNRSSRRLIFQLSLKIILFKLETFILSDVNCFKVGSEHRLALVAQLSTGKWYWTTNLAHLRGTNALSRIARERAGKKVNQAPDAPR